jgi:hypothetical protein
MFERLMEELRSTLLAMPRRQKKAAADCRCPGVGAGCAVVDFHRASWRGQHL